MGNDQGVYSRKQVIMKITKLVIAIVIIWHLAFGAFIFSQQRTMQKQEEITTELCKLVNIQEEVIDASQEVIELQEKVMLMN